MEINEILNEREKTHGDFQESATVAQAMKGYMRYYADWEYLPNTHKEALEMIVHKIGRILAGNPSHKDHWDDIAGYATLVANKLAEPVD